MFIHSSIILVVIAIAFAAARLLKLSIELSMFVAAIAGALAHGAGIPIRHIVDGALGSADYSLNGEVKRDAKAVVMITPAEKLELRKTVLPKMLDKYGKNIDTEILKTLAEKDEVIAEWLKNK